MTTPERWLRRLVADRWARSRTHGQGGYVAAMIAFCLASGLFIGAAAIAVDTSRWYVEMEKVQKAADAAAMGGVPYLPYDFPGAVTMAKQIAARNGFPERDGTTVTVALGHLDSQLKVTIHSRVGNSFGSAFGVTSTTVSRSGTADYKVAAPIGSPCNVFGNEPSSGGNLAAGPTGTTIDATMTTTDPTQWGCTPNPKLWAAIQGPATTKGNGDRFMNRACPTAATPTYKCSANLNEEYDPLGYFYVVQVAPEAVHQRISVQVFDPAYVRSGSTCADLSISPTNNTMNPYVTDAVKRYAKGNTALSNGATFCPGDFQPAGGSGNPPTTSFALRHQTESLDPMQGAPIAGCTKQFAPMTTAPTKAQLTATDTGYNKHLAQIFHNWYELCSFVPDTPGDYYIQVRTNVAPGGTAVESNGSRPALITRDNPAALAATGAVTNTWGLNGFSLRAVTAVRSLQPHVSVAAHERMPMFVSGDSTTQYFHLIRVLPGSAGQKIRFEFFDVADISNVPTTATGTITALVPSDATGSVTTDPFPGGCTSSGGYYASSTTLTGCAATVTLGTNNGQLGTMEIPIPSDYNCNYAKAIGCWYKIKVTLPGTVTDNTTWKATVIGDPVRLIE